MQPSSVIVLAIESWLKNLAVGATVNEVTTALMGIGVMVGYIGGTLRPSELGNGEIPKDPYHIDNYQYNPNDGHWYAAPPQPAYGENRWLEPADSEIEKGLNFRRELSLAQKNNSYDEFFKKYPVPEMKPPVIGDNGYECYVAAQNWRRAADPLTLDLDGDGIETTAQNGWDGVLFDHNNDGIKTGTGWLKGDDGFLVLDRNGNGLIDNGGELFGDNTQLGNGLNAANGFAALADLDSNQDGTINLNDAAFANLRVWQDLNQDGISQADEIKFLRCFL